MRRFCCGLREMGWGKAFDYPTCGEIFDEHAALTAGTDVDITGLSHDVLKSRGPARWPCSKAELGMQRASARLYADGQFATPSGKAQLRALSFENRSEAPTPELPLILTTGRVRDHWHTMTKTGQVNRLRSHVDAPFCEVHPADAAARGIGEGDIVTLHNGRGEVRVKVAITDAIRQGVVFLPMHFGRRLSGNDTQAHGRANNMTSPRMDPVSKEPDLKLAAVQVARHVPARRRIVIVGAGAAAFAFIEAHRRFNQCDEIILLGGEDLPVYDRVLLPHYIEAGGGEQSWRELVRADGGTLLPSRVVFHPNTLVAHRSSGQAGI